MQGTIQLLAAENQCSRAALAALGSILQNKTSEGFPEARLHGGSCVMDEVEKLAIERAEKSVRRKIRERPAAFRNNGESNCHNRPA